MIRSVIITGSIGSGKSQLINRLIFQTHGIGMGLRSLRYFENNIEKGFDWEARDDQQIQTWPLMRKNHQGIFLEKETFARAGEFLKRLISLKPSWIYVDEIGRFERKNKVYLKLLQDIEESPCPSVFVVKKEDLPFNNQLIDKAKKDPGMIFIDKDCSTLEEEEQLLHLLKNQRGRNDQSEKAIKKANTASLRIILMASGFSKRYGQNKLLEIWDNKPLVQHSIDLLASYLYENPALGVGICCAQDGQILRRASDAGLIALYNAEAEEGISASIRLGLSFPFLVQSGNVEEKACFLAADQPLLKKTTFHAFLNQARISTKGIFEACSPQGVGGNPVCYAQKYYGELLDLHGDQGGRMVLRNHKEDVESFVISNDELLDIDFPQDLCKMKKIKKENLWG